MLRGLLYRLYSALKENFEQVQLEAVKAKYKLDDSVELGPGVHLMGQVEIGANSYVNGPGIIYGGEHAKVKIGRWCAIANNVNLRAATHDLDNPTGPNVKMIEADIIIGDHVWIGANVFIKSGVTIGDHAVIGANSVVTAAVAANHIVAGNPARTIRERSS